METGLWRRGRKVRSHCRYEEATAIVQARGGGDLDKDSSRDGERLTTCESILKASLCPSPSAWYLRLISTTEYAYILAAQTLEETE